VRAHQRQEPAKPFHRQTTRQSGHERTIDIRERGLGDLALKNQQLMPEHQDLHVLLLLTHRQQAQQGKSVGRGKVGQAQQHERSSCPCPAVPANTRPPASGDGNHRPDLAG
jgi:hypothetical protein